MTTLGIMALVALAASTIYWIAATRHWMNRAINADAKVDAWETEFARVKGISQNFLNACRLIRIDRNGRMNVFTFARGDKIFQIDTVGMLSDIPDDWRRQAGLDQ